MSSALLERRFTAIGARVKVPRDPWFGQPRINVHKDGRGEYFTIGFEGKDRAVELDVVDVQPRDRHLLLLARVGQEKSKFLLGHDERHWFVAAIPESARGVTGVAAAKEALQPEAVREAVARTRPRDRFRRRNAAYIRQGEWFFLPRWTLVVDERDVLRDEPLTRGRGNDHVLEFAFRRGGETVFVNAEHPAGIGAAEFEQ